MEARRLNTTNSFEKGAELMKRRGKDMVKLRIAFILDPLDQLKAYKDSSIAMMREAHSRGHTLFAILRSSLSMRNEQVHAVATRLELFTDNHAWYAEHESIIENLAAFDVIVMRQDPPFDAEYVAATWMLERAVASGAKVFNSPKAIRDHSEKLSIMEFPQFITPTLVSREASVLHAFVDEMNDVILKPLDGMGGSRIFRVRANDPNRNVIIETLSHDGARTIMAQRYLPEISLGDKRILLIAGKPVPYCLARIPKAGETRGNLAAGGTGIAQPLSERDRDIAETLAPILYARGLFLVGLDVIGQCLTEINVTSPTCFVEITQQTGFDVASLFMDSMERL